MKADGGEEYELVIMREWTRDCEPSVEHCAHNTGQILMSSPPQYPQQCCRCGAQRTIMHRLKLEGHGPFHPARPPALVPMQQAVGSDR